MILADTSVWIGHLRSEDAALSALLDRGRLLGHAFVAGELACGSIRNRAEVLHRLSRLPQAAVAFPAEVLRFIEQHRLAGTGIGYVDAHLLVGARLPPDARLWTLDRRLAAVAARLGLGGGAPPDGG